MGCPQKNTPPYEPKARPVRYMSQRTLFGLLLQGRAMGNCARLQGLPRPTFKYRGSKCSPSKIPSRDTNPSKSARKKQDTSQLLLIHRKALRSWAWLTSFDPSVGVFRAGGLNISAASLARAKAWRRKGGSRKKYMW